MSNEISDVTVLLKNTLQDLLEAKEKVKDFPVLPTGLKLENLATLSLETKLDLIRALAYLWKDKKDVPEILMYQMEETREKYEKKRQIANPKFQFRPAAILICAQKLEDEKTNDAEKTVANKTEAEKEAEDKRLNNEQVRFGIVLAKLFNLELKVRSGGHDHEGECSGTDAIVIDFTELNGVDLKTDGIVRVGPGVQFQKLIPDLNKAKVGIPHGTCGSVGIAGFMFGGGWGPWTRRAGMGCESLVGVTIVLGDGSVETLGVGSKDEIDNEDETSNADEKAKKKELKQEKERNLLWALRGGGGMSYGIVTELVIKTFKLPKNTIAFNITWDRSPALKVLELWEGLIAPDQNPKLIGTNLQIMAKPTRPKGEPIEESVHTCIFHGYYDGTQTELDADMDRWFANLKPNPNLIYKSDEKEAKDSKYFSPWDMIPTRTDKDTKEKKIVLGYSYKNLKELVPDKEEPAPHKITSRLVQTQGLGDEGRKILIESLESDLLSEAGEAAGIQCYVTLGAISGPYYKDYDIDPDTIGSAFPYKNRPYTIQYQAWWDKQDDDKKHPPIYPSPANPYSNAAEDWIDESRQRKFPQTNGSFISFKDGAVPTDEYFLGSYERLKEIKQKYSNDKNNLFRSRKTII